MKLKTKLQLIMIMVNIFTTQEFNKLTSESFTASLKQGNLGSKNDIADFVKKKDFDDKPKNVTSNKNDLNEL